MATETLEERIMRAAHAKNKEKRNKVISDWGKKRTILARTDKIIYAKRIAKIARHRARVKGVPYNITWRDIQIPEFCPILGFKIKLNVIKHSFDSVSLDRIYPDLGYTKGNIIIISYLANAIKNHATPDQLMKVALFYSKLRAENGTH
jgi:regulatory protein YycH of two-component signal transduction system YycFG